jgi:hypothetical protein
VTQDIKVGSNTTLGIKLKTADNMMGEVVVTAMDIKRNPRSMGYSTHRCLARPCPSRLRRRHQTTNLGVDNREYR